jgi:hypothetical protein
MSARYGGGMKQTPVFSGATLQNKLHRIQNELPGWVQRTGQQAQMMPLMQELDTALKGRQWQEVDRLADEILKRISQGP